MREGVNDYHKNVYRELSPLHCAVQLERSDLVEVLIKNGADVSSKYGLLWMQYTASFHAWQCYDYLCI